MFSHFRKTPPILFLLPILAICEVEICTDGGPHVLQITNDSCPFGILFGEPQTADCIVFAGEDESGILADVCTKEAYNPSARQIQFVPEISGEAVEAGSSCKTIMSTMCTLPTKRINKNSFLHPGYNDDFHTNTEKNDSNIQAVGNQTYRLFEYMLGLGDVEIDESARLVELLKISFEITKTFCEHKFVRSEFFDDVLAAFLYLRAESDLQQFMDISEDDYDVIKHSLLKCKGKRTPRKPVLDFHGKKCATYSIIQSVNKSGEMFSDFNQKHHTEFQKYDIPIEATWGAIDFVHGLCYGTFHDDVNMHHLYEQTMEKLFSEQIRFRWKNRYVFQGRQHIWNNFFSANVKNAMINMDLCIQASYLNTPFAHRLGRPVDGETTGAANAKAPKRRRKRWTEPHTLRDTKNVEAVCFQTKEEADSTVQNFCE